MPAIRPGAAFTPQSAWLDLVNSQHWDGFGALTDHLLRRAWVRGYLRGVQASPGAWQAARRELAACRRRLRRLGETAAPGARLLPRDLAWLNAALRAPFRVRLVGAGRALRLEPTPLRRDWAWVRAQAARSLAELLARGQAHRVKTCANPGCRWMFHDSTKGNTRRWCRDAGCGNRDRARRHRARRAGGRR